MLPVTHRSICYLLLEKRDVHLNATYETVPDIVCENIRSITLGVRHIDHVIQYIGKCTNLETV